MWCFQILVSQKTHNLITKKYLRLCKLVVLCLVGQTSYF